MRRLPIQLAPIAIAIACGCIIFTSRSANAQLGTAPAKKVSGPVGELAPARAPSTAPAPVSVLPPAPSAPDLTISISPDKAEIYPGHAFTCTELDATTTPSSPVGSDDGENAAVILADRVPVKGAVRFPSFILDYKGSGKIRLTYAIVKITLPDQDFEFTLDDTELSNLLGIDSSLIIDGPTHIVSNDPNDMRRQGSSPFAPCGLVANEIPLEAPGLGFVAPVEIRMTAYSIDAGADQTEIEVSTSAEVEYIP